MSSAPRTDCSASMFSGSALSSGRKAGWLTIGCPHWRWGRGRYRGGAARRALGGLRLGDELDDDAGVNTMLQLYRDLVTAKGLQRLGQLDPVPVDLQVGLLGQGVGDILVGDGPEDATLLAEPDGDAN